MLVRVHSRHEQGVHCFNRSRLQRPDRSRRRRRRQSNLMIRYRVDVGAARRHTFAVQPASAGEQRFSLRCGPGHVREFARHLSASARAVAVRQTDKPSRLARCTRPAARRPATRSDAFDTSVRAAFLDSARRPHRRVPARLEGREAGAARARDCWPACWLGMSRRDAGAARPAGAREFVPDYDELVDLVRSSSSARRLRRLGRAARICRRRCAAGFRRRSACLPTT